MANGTQLDRFFAVLGLEVDQGSFQKGRGALGNLTNAAGHLKTAMLGIFGGIGVRSIARNFREISREADRVTKTAQQFGLAAKDYQAFAFAAERSGVSQEQFNAAILKLPRKIFDAKTSTTLQKTFGALGLSASQLAKSDPATQFRQIAAAMGRVGDQTRKVAFASQLFEEGGPKLLNLFNNGAEGLAALEKQFSALGGGFDDETLARAAQFEDTMTNLSVVATKAKIAFFSLLYPVKDLVDGLIEFTQSGEQFTAFLKVAKVVGLGLAGTLGLLAAALLKTWLVGLAPMLPVILGVSAAIFGFGLILDEIYVTLKGGDSILNRFYGWIERTRDAGGALAAVAETLSGWFGGIGETIAALLDPVDSFTTKIQKLVDLIGRLSGLKGAFMLGEQFADRLNLSRRLEGGLDTINRGVSSTVSNVSNSARQLTVNVTGASPERVLEMIRGEFGHAEEALTPAF